MLQVLAVRFLRGGQFVVGAGLMFCLFAKTIRIGTMHVLRMHVTETEETQELRITWYFVFS